MIQDFYILSSARQAPKSLVVILHGYGADGKNLLFMAHYWKNLLKNTLFILPTAPFPLHHSINEGYQWFDIGDLEPSYLEKGSQEAAPFLRDFITKIQTAYKISGKKTVLAGFSQGSMMALATGLLHENLCQGILSYSGGLFLAAERLSPASAQIDFCLIHGRDDSVVPYTASTETRDFLVGKVHTVTLHSLSNLGHEISETGLQQGAEFISSLNA